MDQIIRVTGTLTVEERWDEEFFVGLYHMDCKKLPARSLTERVKDGFALPSGEFASLQVQLIPLRFPGNTLLMKSGSVTEPLPDAPLDFVNMLHT